jgi:hypothetical protein
VSVPARVPLFGQALCRSREDTPNRRFEALWGAFRDGRPTAPFTLVSVSAPLVSCMSLSSLGPASPEQYSVNHARPAVRQRVSQVDYFCRAPLTGGTADSFCHLVNQGSIENW